MDNECCGTCDHGQFQVQRKLKLFDDRAYCLETDNLVAWEDRCDKWQRRKETENESE